MAKCGRPTKYSEAYCDEVIETMATGLSLTAFAGDIGVARETVNEWRRVHPEFSAAVKVGQAKRTAALERHLMTLDNGPQITARIFALKNADPEEWRDKREVEHSGDVRVETVEHRIVYLNPQPEQIVSPSFEIVER